MTRAVAVIGAGGLAVLPAEGLYGFHVRPDRPAALERLRALKPREEGRGWIGLLDEPGALQRFAAAPAHRAVALAQEFWPGALTLVVAASPEVPVALWAADGSVALRCPGSDFLRAIARASDGFLISTSANAPGAPPPARIEDLVAAKVDLIVDAGPLSGVPSTIVRVSGDDVRMLREGAVILRGGTT